MTLWSAKAAPKSAASPGVVTHWGPPFQTNLVRAQRFLQMSAAWPLGEGQARMIPIIFHHAPSAPKPPKDASPEQLTQHGEQRKQMRLNAQALEQMKLLGERCPATRSLIFCGEGSYTIVKNLPVQCTYIGRIRKDAKRHHLPGVVEAKINGRVVMALRLRPPNRFAPTTRCPGKRCAPLPPGDIMTSG